MHLNPPHMFTSIESTSDWSVRVSTNGILHETKATYIVIAKGTSGSRGADGAAGPASRSILLSTEKKNIRYKFRLTRYLKNDQSVEWLMV